MRFFGNKLYYTVPEAAVFAKVPRQTLLRRMRMGVIFGMKLDTKRDPVTGERLISKRLVRQLRRKKYELY